MNILYIGDDTVTTTSYHRASALKRIGCNVDIKNPKEAGTNQFNSKIISKLHYHTGYRFLRKKIKRWLETIFNENDKFDLVWVNGGEYFGKECILFLKSKVKNVVLYNNDDPTGGRDSRRFDSLLMALPYYDLCVAVREVNRVEYMALGCKNVIRIYMSYDEEFHKPFDTVAEIPQHFRSEVAFIGTWMRHEHRDKFLVKLAENGIPLSIWGDHWKKSPLWSQIKPYYRGAALKGKEYVAAIQGAKVCIGMLSKGNRDMHTTRSFETTYIGGVLCAERTKEHNELYIEGVEAVFWEDVNECIEACKLLLGNNELRESVRINGMKRVRELKVGNEDICRKILSAL